VLISKNNIKIFKNKKIKTKNTHGTGCTLSSAIASFISKNYNMNESCRRSIQYVHKAILLNPKFGRGHGPINHMALLN
jgi:hydroxymethylpyrimidine/phosphomethylpyrimidine kinase